MDANTKKTALRMIPYGLYVLTAVGNDDQLTAAAVSWVTQTSFNPPMLVVAIKVDSASHNVVKQAGHFALNVLGKGQQDMAFAFFKPTVREGQTLNGQPFRRGSTGAPILENTPGFVECEVVEVVERGDHSIFVGQVVEAGVAQVPTGRPDEETLLVKDLGGNVFYSG